MGEAAAIKVIYDEVAPSSGVLADWLRQPHVTGTLVLHEPTDLARVQHVPANGYAPDLSDVEIEKLGQDPFLIAAALGEVDRVIVTREVSKPSKTRAGRRIPDVCATLGLVAIADFELYRRLNFAIR
jgi:Domain of unknown function (DUF4411)